jgi:hypothetical protein
MRDYLRAHSEAVSAYGDLKGAHRDWTATHRCLDGLDQDDPEPREVHAAWSAPRRLVADRPV